MAINLFSRMVMGLCLLSAADGLAVTPAKLKALPRKKLTVIGIDAGDLITINHLRARGLLPTFNSLIETGASGPLESIYPMFSPIVWTTIATGASPIEHGIRGFNLYQPEENKSIPSNSVTRQRKAVWQILSDANLKSLVVAWFNSWPADRIKGAMVTDYVFQIRKLKQTRAFIKKLGLGFRYQTYPQNILGKVSRFLIDRDGPHVEFRKRFGVPMKKAPFAVRHSWAKDTSYFHMFQDLRKSHDLDFHALYLQGPDLIGHQFMQEFSLWAAERLQKGTASYQKGYYAVAYYQHIDRLLKTYLEEIREPNETLLIVSDHGFEDKGKAVLARVSDANFAKRRFWHRKHGLVIANGPDVKPGKITGATVFDVTPTILAFFDLPVARNMRGSPLPQVVRGKPKVIQTYENVGTKPGGHAYTKYLLERITELKFTQSRN